MTPVGAVQWRYFADTVMGGVSEGTAAFEDGVLRLTGTVSTANNGGFIQVRTDLPQGAPDAATGLRIRVRGNGARYFIHLRTRASRLPWQYYQAGFSAGASWSEIALPFAEFRPSGGGLPETPRAENIRSLALVAYGADYEADVSLSGFAWA